MNNIYIWLTAIVAILLCEVGAAGPCNERSALSSSTARFSFNESVATDTQTRLQWQRCPVGYDYDDNDTEEPLDDLCVDTGSSPLSWADALQAAVDKNAAAAPGESADWRVPNIKELLSIVERQCINPAINTAVFPQPASTFIGAVWSSTYANNLVGGARSYLMDFSSGAPIQESREAGAAGFRVILVRTIVP